MKKLRFELGDTRNRGLRKTLIFENIPFQQQRHIESWDESKEILAKEIIKVFPQFQVSDIIEKIERAHRKKNLNFQKYRLSLQNLQTET